VSEQGIKRLRECPEVVAEIAELARQRDELEGQAQFYEQDRDRLQAELRSVAASIEQRERELRDAGNRLVEKGNENDENFDWLLHPDTTDEGSPDGYHRFSLDDLSNIECERKRWREAVENWAALAPSDPTEAE